MLDAVAHPQTRFFAAAKGPLQRFFLPLCAPPTDLRRCLAYVAPGPPLQRIASPSCNESPAVCRAEAPGRLRCVDVLRYQGKSGGVALAARGCPASSPNPPALWRAFARAQAAFAATLTRIVERVRQPGIGHVAAARSLATSMTQARCTTNRSAISPRPNGRSFHATCAAVPAHL